MTPQRNNYRIDKSIKFAGESLSKKRSVFANSNRKLIMNQTRNIQIIAPQTDALDSKRTNDDPFSVPNE